ncbi:D-Ala-D-Ala carboxypeptidase family metallohydrolase [Akkermansiaceae bacterium]|nr:D-Ala-D-Ala carboxypeptidase family metallohydrolase [Akkermansiaceae bacterium]
MQLSNHFSSEEFKCNCQRCEDKIRYFAPLALLMVLEDIRVEFDKPVTITSAKRCEDHNAKVGGGKRSKHLEGIAADIVVEGADPSEVYKFITELHYADLLGVGSYDTFTHVDVRGSKARW